MNEEIRPFDKMPDTVIIDGEKFVDPIPVNQNGWFPTPYGVVELLRITGVKVELQPLTRNYKLSLPVEKGKKAMFQTFKITDTIEDWQDAIRQLYIARDNESARKNPPIMG